MKFTVKGVSAKVTIYKNNIITIKKLKKGGLLEEDMHNMLVYALKRGEIIGLPVDFVYGMVCAANADAEKGFREWAENRGEEMVSVVSSFKMLDEIAVVDKFRFDFLHRIWPGNVVVKLRRKETQSHSGSIHVLIPKNKFLHELVESIKRPLLLVRGFNSGRYFGRDEKKLINEYLGKVSFVIIIDELIKEYPSPTIVDLTDGDLSIIQEGKISSDEIKSLYFLDKI